MESQTSDPIKFISKTLVLLFLCILAVFSILTVLSQIAGLSFRSYAILGTSSSSLFTFLFFYANKERFKFDGKTNKYPFPLVLGITNTLAAKEMLRKKTALKITSLLLYVLALGFAFSSPRTISILNPENILRFPPQYKLSETQAVLAPKIIDEIPQGTMLSPPELAGIIPLFSASHPQIRIREDGLRLWFATCGLTPQAAELRFAASNFVGGDRDEFSKFKGFLEEEGDILTSILIHHSVLDSETQELLNTHHFVFQTKIASYAIYLRR